MTKLSTVPPTSVIDALGELSDALRGRLDEIESARRLPGDLHERFREIGVYRLLLPSEYGGLQSSPDEVLDVIETLARIDGSVAWAATVGIQSPAVFSWLARERFEELHTADPDVTIGGAFAPHGRAEKVNGGFQVTGRWTFASGIDNWDWVFANCLLTSSGGPVMGPMGPAMRAMVVPTARADILDTWRTLGMRGTGSQDFVLTDVFVPADLSFDLGAAVPSVDGITRYPLVEFGFELATIAIGVAQGALNDLADSAAGRTRGTARTSIAKDLVAQHRIGRAATSLAAAKALVRSEAAGLRRMGPDVDFLTVLGTTSATCAWVVDVAIDVVETCFRTFGAPGIFDGSSLQRRLRDIMTLSQHATLNDSAWTRAGAALFGVSEAPPAG